MTLFVVGTGRCGTKTVAQDFTNQGIQARHEPHNELLVELAVRYTLGQVTVEQAARVLRHWCAFGAVESSYKLSELIIPLRAAAHDDTEFLWVYRRPLDTVASMVGKGWYAADEETYLPYSLTWWSFAPEASLMFDVNWRAFRTTAPLVGLMSLSEWRSLGQAGRCGWWWDWCNRRIAETLPAGSERTPIEGFGVRENRGRGCSLSAADTLVVEGLCGETEAMLYD